MAKLRLVSLKTIANSFIKILLRFPVAVFITFTGTASVILMIEDLNHGDWQYQLGKIFTVSFLGMPLMISLQLIAERFKLTGFRNWVLKLFGIGLLIAYYFSLPANVWDGAYQNMYRFALLLIAGHLLVSIAPFLRKADQEQFWNYNKTLFLRFFTGSIYTVVLFLGCALAVWSLDELFGVKLHDEIYGELWCGIAGVFNTLFFLYGIPKFESEDDEAYVFPTPLKFFSAYILTPLVILYLVILYCYEAKILINWAWPNGWVSNLLIGFSIAGILAQLLVYPIRKIDGNKWIQQFSRFFFIIIIPLLAMLFLAILRRVHNYGFTPERYYVMASAVWLAGITIYFLVKRFNNIHIIPYSLFFVCLISAYGPVSSFHVSESNQLSRLKTYLQKASMLKDGKIIPCKTDPENKFELNNITAFMVENFGLKSLQPLYDFPLEYTFYKTYPDTQSSYNNTYEQKQFAMKMMGLSYDSYWYNEEDMITNHNFYPTDDARLINIAGYDYMYNFSVSSMDKRMITANNDSASMELADTTGTVILYQNHQEIFKAYLFPWVKVLSTTFSDYAVPANQFVFKAETDKGKFMIRFSNIETNSNSGKLVGIESISGTIFWKLNTLK